MSAFLLVRVAAKRYAFPIRDVDQIVAVENVLPVPHVRSAVRGVMRVRDRLVPLAHLGALLSGDPPPAMIAAQAVLAVEGGRRVALEVDAADDLHTAVPMPAPSGWGVRWSRAVLRVDDASIPVLDLPEVLDSLSTAEGVTHG